MLPHSNIHTHTTFSDGRDAPEAMVQAAIALGFHTLGFSDHGVAAYDDSAMPAGTEPQYRAEVLRLREKYAGQIAILLGYEHDALAEPVDYPYDITIESVHYVRAGGGVFSVDYTRPILEEAAREYYGGNFYALCRDYFRAVAESCAGDAAILGHMDLVMKFNERRDLFDDADPRYLTCALEAAEQAVKRGKLIEVNNGAVAKGYRTAPYPGEALLRRLAEWKAPMIITSDCHDLRYLNCNFDGTASLLKACGFKTAFEYRGRSLEEYPL